MKDVFSSFAPFVQDFIYRNRWESLRGIQVAAADVIFNTDDNLLLCASTASGKTEAAFFPIISQFYEKMPGSVGCIYIGPLKALINDQFERLSFLCEEGDIPVWHWHGDVSQSHKERLMKNPSGILQITPESLEALLLHRHSAIPHLFGDLRYVVVDEIHSLLRGDRGGQTMCLIERLGKLAQVNPRRIGLSATIGDPVRVGEFLSQGTGRRTAIPKVKTEGDRWRISMEHFYVKDVDEAEEIENNFRDPGLSYIYDHTRDKKCLVFVNSREECETVTNTLRHYCELDNEADRFLIHHGNLSASFRESAEEIMKDEEETATTVTTSTLELGIDIGRLERAFQIDAPWTVCSFLQRMGRTGRRGEPSQMWFVIREDEPEIRALMPATVPWKLLQAIALVQLYVEDRWVEPPRLDRLPFSLLYHQTMSTIYSCGELAPAALAERVLTLSYFHRITQEDLKVMLRHLIETEHVEMTEAGGLIIGLRGERVINNFRFYGVFQESEEFTVRSESEEIGTLVLPPPVGEKIAIAGHVWEVTDIDRKKKIVYCEMVKGNVPAYFGECAGDLHTRIVERMRQVLTEEKSYPYLLQNAVKRLESARFSAKKSGLAERPLIHLGGRMWVLFPWLGTYAFLAMERFLRLKCARRLGLKKLDPARPYYMQFTMKESEETFYEVVREEAKKKIDPMSLVYPKEIPVFEKYDEYLPPELLKKGFAYGVLDIEGMVKRVLEWRL